MEKQRSPAAERGSRCRSLRQSKALLDGDMPYRSWQEAIARHDLNLNQTEELPLKIDETVKITRPDGWRGVLQDVDEVERIFLIIKAQTEY